VFPPSLSLCHVTSLVLCFLVGAYLSTFQVPFGFVDSLLDRADVAVHGVVSAVSEVGQAA
jgi:hypothetical protein